MGNNALKRLAVKSGKHGANPFIVRKMKAAQRQPWAPPFKGAGEKAQRPKNPPKRGLAEPSGAIKT